MFVLLILCLLLGCLIVVPLLLVGLALRLVFALVLLPFQVAGLAVRLVIGLLGGLVLAGALLLIPLLPIIAIVGGIWLIVRLSRRHPAARLAAD